MPAKISISACRRAIRRAGDIPLVSRGTTTLITISAVQGREWVSGEVRLTRAEQEALTQSARAILRGDIHLLPKRPPSISLRECQQVIALTGGISITLRGQPMRITEVVTQGGGITRWFTGTMRYTLKEQKALPRP